MAKYVLPELDENGMVGEPFGNPEIVLYHGSTSVIEMPLFGHGKMKNDYGQGFYCTEKVELAKEWACASGNDGYANKYLLDVEQLNVLYLNSVEYHILNWLAILLDNRTFGVREGISLQARNYILDHFLPDYKSYDVIVGYRADDSYFSYAGDFLENTLSLENLRTAMSLGKLGEQVVMKSRKAFDSLHFVEAIPADYKEFHAKYSERDTKARGDYREMKESSSIVDGIYVLDIIRGKWRNDDPRLR